MKSTTKDNNAKYYIKITKDGPYLVYGISEINQEIIVEEKSIARNLIKMANEIITTLHPDQDPNTNLYPNIKKENIPNILTIIRFILVPFIYTAVINKHFFKCIYI